MSHGAFGGGLQRPLQNFDLAVAAGAVQNTNNNQYEQLVLLGANAGIVSTGFNAMKFGGGAFNFPQAPEFVRIAAGGNVNDTALGTGATAIVVQGIGEDFEPVDLIVPTNGALASALTSVKLWRVNSCAVVGVGTYGGTNVGDIEIEYESAGEVLTIEAGAGLSRYGARSTPRLRTAFADAFLIQVEGQKEITFRVFRRERFDDLSSFGPVLLLTELRALPPGVTSIPLTFRFELSEKSDTFVTAQTSAGNGSGVFVLASKSIPNK